VTTQAELRALLLDCLTVWGVSGEVTAGDDGLTVTANAAACVVRAGPAPTRWFVTVGGRSRPVPSVVALLSAVRRGLGVAPGVRARVGAGAALQ
jgi:hypothetical protein